MSDYDIHSCGYYCDRHACIVAQRNELRDKLFSNQAVKTYSGGKPNYTEPIEQEPVAWGVDEGEGRCIDLHDLYFVQSDAQHMAELKGTHAKAIPLYTAPPNKEWVGLTDDEMLMIYAQPHEGFKYSLGRMVQAKLKEKNNG
jgi:hypothetical protein